MYVAEEREIHSEQVSDTTPKPVEEREALGKEFHVACTVHVPEYILTNILHFWRSRAVSIIRRLVSNPAIDILWSSRTGRSSLKHDMSIDYGGCASTERTKQVRDDEQKGHISCNNVEGFYFGPARSI